MGACSAPAKGVEEKACLRHSKDISMRKSRGHASPRPAPFGTQRLATRNYFFVGGSAACQKLAGLRPMSHSAKASRLAPTHFTSDTLHLSGLKPWAHSRASLPSSSCERLQ